MIPSNFDYKKVSTVQEAITLMKTHGYDAKLVSGGHSLVPAMKLRLNRPAMLVDVSGIPGMNNIVEDGDSIVVGANCTHKDIMVSEVVKSHVKVLADTAGAIGDIQIRNRGTLGGSLAHADPASDYPATVLATEATIIVEGSNGSRSIPANDFFEGIFTTALEDDEIIIAVSFPKVSQGVYVKFPQPASRFAVVGCAVVKSADGIKVGVTGVSDTPYRATAVESAYQGSSDAAAHAVDGVDVMGDQFASEEYRAHLAKVFVKRAIDAVA